MTFTPQLAVGEQLQTGHVIWHGAQVLLKRSCSIRTPKAGTREYFPNTGERSSRQKKDSSEEHLSPLPRVWVQFPAPHGVSEPGNSMTSSGFCGHCGHMVHIHVSRKTLIHIQSK